MYLFFIYFLYINEYIFTSPNPFLNPELLDDHNRSRLFYRDIFEIQTFLDILFDLKTVNEIEPTHKDVVTARARRMSSPRKTRTRSGGYYKRKYRNTRNNKNKN